MLDTAAPARTTSATTPAPTPAKTYRADIDGLRAVAVVAVVLAHNVVRGFSGGFLGVDVFFVISGYLIYRDLVTRLAEGRLSVFAFYGRRMRRTLPALYLVCAVTLAGATLILMPGDLADLARSMIAVVALVPNIFYLTHTGYFDGAATGRPLIHTWSLGVEEQFYLLAPLLPLALRGLAPARRKIILVVIFAVALALTIGVRLVALDAAFYLMPARAFEFLIGCLLAEEVVPAITARWLAETTTAGAAIALAIAITAFSDATPLPGALSLVPCLATAAIIHVGGTRRTMVGAALGLRGPAFVGLISYSLYLWHWPMIIAVRSMDLPVHLPFVLGAICVLFSFSVLSWRFVEKPFRDPRAAWRARAPVLLPAAAAGLVACCVLVAAAAGVPGRFPAEVVSVASYYPNRDPHPYREGRCFITSKSRLADFDRTTCLKIVPGKKNVLLIGDSHAAHLWTGLVDTWPGVNFLQATASGCKPVVGSTGASRCTAMMADMIERFIPDHHLDAVAIGGLWDNADIAPLRATIAVLRPHVGRIVVFGPMPHWDQPVATLIARAMLNGRLTQMQRHLRGPKPLDDRMRAALGPIATYVSTFDAICPGGRCRLFAGAGVPMQYDFHHLTKEGADRMMETIRATDGPLF